LANEPDLSAWAQWTGQADPIAFYQSARSLVACSDRGELLSLFQNLKKKAYVHGAKNPQKHLLPHLTNIPTFAIPDGGHFMMWDQSTSFYTCVKSWLEVQT
jgi:hypothetical protein